MSQYDDDCNDSLDTLGKDDEEFEKKEWVPSACKYCGKGGLEWGLNRQGKWVLYTPGGRKHTCKQFSTGFQKAGKTIVIK